jgi:hypothetical protein
MLSSLRRLDYFKKFKDEYEEMTSGNRVGGVVSVVSIVLMLILSVSTLRTYIRVYDKSEIALLYEETVGEGDVFGKNMRLTFNVTMDHLPCEYLSVDVQNGLGRKKLNISTNVQRRVVKHGKIDATSSGRVHKQDHFHEEIHKDDPVHGIPLGMGKVNLLTKESFSGFTRDAAREAVWVNFHAPWCSW